DWSAYLRERHANARLTDEQVAGIRWLAAQPGGPAKVLVISEDWSSDCRRDVPYLARLAEAGGAGLGSFSPDRAIMVLQCHAGAAAGGPGGRCARVREPEYRPALRHVPGGRLPDPRLSRAVSLHRVSGHLPQGPGDRPSARGAGRRDGGTGQGARRPRDRRPPRVALLRSVGHARDPRAPPRPPPPLL